MSDVVELPRYALTLWQPWAWLVASGYKPIENRPKGFAYKSFRGDFWIHAGAEPDGRTFDIEWEKAVALCRRFVPGLANRMTVALNSGQIAFGAIIGRARIDGVVEPKESLFF